MRGCPTMHDSRIVHHISRDLTSAAGQEDASSLSLSLYIYVCVTATVLYKRNEHAALFASRRSLQAA